jgi:malonyl-CoA/methylmalonyl-CoA synthetase
LFFCCFVEQHALIAEVAVLGVEDERWGERVAAVARLRDPAALAEAARARAPEGRGLPPMVEPMFLEGREPAALLPLEDLRAWVRGRMPTYRAPSRLIVLPQIPKNAMGKVNKKDLRKLFCDEP